MWRTLAVGVRFDFAVTDRIMLGALTAALVAISLHAVIGHTQYLYRGRHAFGSFDEVRAVSATVLGTSALVLGLDLAAPHRARERLDPRRRARARAHAGRTLRVPPRARTDPISFGRSCGTARVPTFPSACSTMTPTSATSASTAYPCSVADATSRGR